MKILAIETSCDETAVSILEARGDIGDATFSVLGNALFSQVDIHRVYGGVFPALAKREHAQNLAPLLQAALSEADMFVEAPHYLDERKRVWIEILLTREPMLARNLLALLERIQAPPIDLIAVTQGPGLEPALWVGVNAARVLSLVWNRPLVPTNHLEGHLVSSLMRRVDDTTYTVANVQFPVLGLIISGGHTELVHMEGWHMYEKIGGTKDDALGEAYDKVGRMLDLPYPGGSGVARLAQEAREEGIASPFTFPRPLKGSDDHLFSFSGLKTAVMYALKKWKAEHGDVVTDLVRKQIALAFEDAIRDTIIDKVRYALATMPTKTLVVGGGVAANAMLRDAIATLAQQEYPDIATSFPDIDIATDNAIMIGMAGAMRVENALHPKDGALMDLRAVGELKLK